MFNGIALQAIDTCLWQVQYQYFPASGWSSWGFPVWSSFYERYSSKMSMEPLLNYNIYNIYNIFPGIPSLNGCHMLPSKLSKHSTNFNQKKKQPMPGLWSSVRRCRKAWCHQALKRSRRRRSHPFCTVKTIMPSGWSHRGLTPKHRAWRVTVGALGDRGNDCGNAQKMTELQVKWVKCE